MKKIFLLLVTVIAAISILAGCTANGAIKKTYNAAKEKLLNGEYDSALADFKAVKSMIATEENLKGFEQLDAYIYACSYYILSQYLQSHGDLTFDYDENYIVPIECYEEDIYVGYEGKYFYERGGEYEGRFQNFFFYIPQPSTDSPAVPDYFEWYYAESDIMEGYKTIAKANGVLEPMNWFELSKQESGRFLVDCTLYNEDFEESGVNTTYMYNLIPYFGKVLDYLDIGLSLEDLGINDLQNAIDNFG